MNNTAQSNPEGELERLGGLRKSREPEEEGLNSEGLGGVADGVSEENAKKRSTKKHKKLPVVVGILVVLVVAGGGIAWWVLEGRSSESGDNVATEDEDMMVEQGDKKAGKDNENKDKDTSEDVVTTEELALDDSLVQRLYGYFGNAGWAYDNRWHVYVGGLDKKDEAARKMKLHFAKDALETSKCRGEYYYENGEAGALNNLASECYAGDDIRNKYNEIFGETVKLVEGEELELGVYEFNNESGTMFACGWRYDANRDEFHETKTGCGGGMPAMVERELKKAVRLENKIELYEKALLWREGMTYRMGETVKDFFGEEIVQDGHFSEEQTKEMVNREGDEFKWTFVKNAEGNYVFEKIERIK